MSEIQSMTIAQRVVVLKKLADKEKKSSWKLTLNYLLLQISEEFILKCNFDTRKLPIDLPYLRAFYKER